MPDNRSGNQVREKDDEQRIVDQPIMFRFIAMDIHQIANLREGEERDGEWQDQVKLWHRLIGNASEQLQKEIGVFVITQENQVAGDTREEKEFPAPLPVPANDAFRRAKIETHRSQQQRDIFDLPIGVENKRNNDQPALARVRPGSRQAEEDAQNNG